MTGRALALSLQRSRLVVVAATVLCFAGLLAHGAASAQTGPGVEILPLERFMPVAHPIVLRNATSRFNLYVPVSERVSLSRAILHLQYSSSASILAARSHLVVSLDGKILSQLKLGGDGGARQVDIELPAEKLQPGYRELTFTVAQHYTEKCEDPLAPELWTQIDVNASTLALTVQPKVFTPLLSDLRALFDKKQWGRYGLKIVTASAQLQDDHLRWGALAAQGAALRLEYLPLDVEHAQASAYAAGRSSSRARFNFPGLAQEALVGSDAVMLGTRDELAPFISEAMAGTISGSFLGVFPLDRDPTHFVVVISGREPNEVLQAAIAFARVDITYPSVTAAVITGIEAADVADYSAQHGVEPNRRYKFSELGFESQSFYSTSPAPARLEVSLPPDLFSPLDRTVTLSLHLVYGAGMRFDSVLNIFLNGRFENAIHLREGSGAVYRDYRFSIPLSSFQGGRNIIEFQPSLMPSVTGECAAIQQENLRLTLYDNSTITLPKAAHVAHLPDLSRFARTGYPFTVRPGGEQFAMYVSGRNRESIAAAWMLSAKLAQLTGVASPKAEYSFSLPKKARHVIAVGALEGIDPQILGPASLQLGDRGELSFPLARETSVSNADVRGSRRGRLASAWGSAQSGPVGSLMGRGVLIEFESPLFESRAMLLVATQSAGDLPLAMQRLLEPVVWNSLEGGVVFWGDQPGSFRSQTTDSYFQVGSASWTERLEYYFSMYPRSAVTVLILLLVVFAVTTHYLLIAFKRQHHPKVGDAR